MTYNCAYYPCSMAEQSHPQPIPPSPIHQLINHEFPNLEEKETQHDIEQCLQIQTSIKELERQIENLQNQLEIQQSQNLQSVAKVTEKNLQIAHWQKGYFSYSQLLAQIEEETRQIEEKIISNQKIKQQSLSTTIQKSTKTYKKIVPQSKWEGTDLEQTLRTLNSSLNYKQKYKTPQKKPTIFEKSSSGLKEKDKKEEIKVPRLSVRINPRIK